MFIFSTSSSITDHLNAGGIAAPINLDGIVYSKAVNKENELFIYHPITNVKLPGLKIEAFEELIEFVEKLAIHANKLGVSYVGWDVVPTIDGFEVIEGNHDPGHASIQLVTKKGFYKDFKRILKNQN